VTGFPEYDSHDGLGLAELVRAGEVTPLELVEEAIARVEAVNPRLNAVVTPMYDAARGAAEGGLPDGAFRGVPFLLKDLIAAYAGVPLTCGCRFYRDYVPDFDAEIVKRHKAAGLVVVGKTNTPELGIVAVTEPELHGPTHTPWRLGHTSGGSSGGSAAAVAAGVVPMAHGGDGGGSIRIPAACCGVFGFKPTRGRTPTGPNASEHWKGFAIEHALTRSVRDSAALLDATTGQEVDSWYYTAPPKRSFLKEVRPKKKTRALRVAVTTAPHLPGQVHPDCVGAVEEVAKLCEELGHQVEEVTLDTDPQGFARDFLTMVAVSTAVEMDQAAALVGRAPSRRDFETATWLLGMMGRQIGAARYEAALTRLQSLARQVARASAGWDVLLSPTLGKPPVRVGELQPNLVESALQQVVAGANLGPVLRVPGILEGMAEKVFEFVPFTPLANVTGQPSMNVPLVWNEQGLPVGTMFTAGFGDDATLFQLAGQLERLRPWKDRRPPVHASETAAPA